MPVVNDVIGGMMAAFTGLPLEGQGLPSMLASPRLTHLRIGEDAVMNTTTAAGSFVVMLEARAIIEYFT